MTNLEIIKNLDLEDMATFIEYGATYDLTPPGCDEGCDNFRPGCGRNCLHGTRIRAVKDWLEEEVNG